MPRSRITHSTSFEQRLEVDAVRLRERAGRMPPSLDRDVLIRKARQLETAANINEWLSSPGLRPAK